MPEPQRVVFNLIQAPKRKSSDAESSGVARRSHRGESRVLSVVQAARGTAGREGAEG